MKKLIKFIILPALFILLLYALGTALHNRLSYLDDQKQKRAANYVLNDPIHPTHWNQSQWDTLNKYLKRIDELEKRIEALEQAPH